MRSAIMVATALAFVGYGVGQQQTNPQTLTQASSFPLGAVMAFAGPETAIPQGWLPCDGRPLPRRTFRPLLDVIGTTWGASDPSSFNLPDLRGRTIVGSGSGNGLTPRSLGASVGMENAPLLSHRHTAPAHFHLWLFPGGGANINTGNGFNTAALRGDNGEGFGLQTPGHNTASTGGLRTDSRGADPTSEPIAVSQQPGSNMQPSAVVTFICRVR